MTDESEKGAWTDRPDDGGWWEYGVGGYTQGKAKGPTPPHFAQSHLAAEIEAERYESLYVVRRWVTPGVWEKVIGDDHAGVDDWTWSKYLEWRDKQLAKVGAEAAARLNPAVAVDGTGTETGDE